MIKLIKWLIYSVVFSLFLLLASGVFIIWKVDPNDYKDRIAAQVTRHTGSSLVIGDLSWRFYPFLGFEVGGISLDNPPGFLPTKMLTAKSAKVYVALLPLLRQQLTIDSIELNKPLVNLSVNVQGVANWDALAGAKANQGAYQNEPISAQAGVLLSSLIIKGVNINDGAFNWHDQRIDQRINLSQLNMQVEKNAPGVAIDFALAALLEGSVVASSTQITASGALDMGSLNALSLRAAKLSIEQSQLAASLDIDWLNYAPSSNTVQASSVLLQGRYAAISFSGVLRQLAFDLNKNRITGGAQSYEVDVLGVQSKAEIPAFSLSIENQQLDIPAITLRQGEAKIDLSVRASQLFSDLNVQGNIATNSLKLRDLLPTWTGINLDNLPDSALTTVQLQGAYKATRTGFSLTDLIATVDESNISGRLSLDSYAAPAYRFALAVDRLNMDNYLAANEAVGAAGVVALPFVVLKGLDAQGEINIADFRYQGLHSSNLVLNADAKQNRITIAPLRANLYGGEVVNNISYDFSGAAPKVHFKTHLANIKLAPFLQAMQLGERFSGVAEVTAEVDGFGLTASEFIANMNGTIKINLNDGAIVGVNVQKLLLDVASAYKSLIGKDLIADTEVGDKTEFSNFSALVQVKNGVLASENISLQAPAIRLTGRGNVDLNQEKLDLAMVVAIVKTLEGQGGKSFAELQGESLSLTITGDLAAPKVKIDLAALLQKHLKKELKKQLTQKVIEKYGEEYGIGTDETEATISPKEALKAKLKAEKNKLKNKLLKSLFGG